MPVKQGTFSTSPIYNGIYKIGKIFRGLDLVYSSGDPKSTLDINNFVKVRVHVADLFRYNEYELVKNGTVAVEGTQYYTWSVNENKIVPLSTTTGQTLPYWSFTYNTNYNESTATYINLSILGFYNTNYILPEKCIINGNDKFNTYDNNEYPLMSIDLSKYNSHNVQELGFYNLDTFPSLDLSGNPTRASLSIQFNKSDVNYHLANVKKMILKEAIIALDASLGKTKVIGTNVSDGVEVIVTGNKYTSSPYFGNNNQDLNLAPALGNTINDIYGAFYKIKSIKFNTPNLSSVGGISVNYDNMNTSSQPTVEIPNTVRSIGQSCNGIYYDFDVTEPTMKAKIKGEDTLVWRSINMLYSDGGSADITFPNDTIGIAGTTFDATTNDRFHINEIIIPETVKYISSSSIHNSGGNTSIILNANIESDNGNCLISSAEKLNKIVFGEKVTNIPKSLFNNVSEITNGITFNAPANTPITIGEGAFYYKSARAVNIYYHAPNNSITGFDWSSQNVTPTFIEL